MLKELHSGHQGIMKVKALSCKYVWWPKVDADVRMQVCRACVVRLELEKNAHRLCWTFLGAYIHES